jgi:hypothetical protein
MGVEVQHIKDFTPGNAFQIHRKVVNPGRPDAIISATLEVISSSGHVLLKREIKRYHPRDTSVPNEGLIINPGDKEPFVVDFKINLFSNETHILSGNPHYNIRFNTVSQVYNIETGLFISEYKSIYPETFGNPLPPPPPSPPPSPPTLISPIPGDPGYSSPISYSTYANSCVTVNGRAALIIDGFLDAILGDYRQLKVWDEHARRTANDPFKLRLIYEYLNTFTTPEIYDGYNNAINPDEVTFDFRNGVFSVASDDGNQDYFCTYTFNFFPEPILRMYMQQTVLNMNFIGAGAGGGYITNYQNLEQTPPAWDGLIALGSAALAWKRLATNISLWRNWLIFEGDVGEGVQSPGGAAAQQAANDAATYYQSMFDSYAAATKFDRFVIGPTQTWQVFATTGFGSFGMIGQLGTENQIWEGKFRGLTINKSFSF